VTDVLVSALFLKEAHALWSRAKRQVADLMPMRLFHYSITYVSVLFLAIAIDPLLH
jgi:protoheme IX farnesyltransferase